MDREAAIAEYRNPTSVMEAVGIIQGQCQWLEYVEEHEFTTAEREAIMKACKAFYASIRPLTAKYID